MSAPTYPIPTMDLRAVEQGMSQMEWKRLQGRIRAEAGRARAQARYERSVRRWREWTVEAKCAALLAGEPLDSVNMPKMPERPGWA